MSGLTLFLSCLGVSFLIMTVIVQVHDLLSRRADRKARKLSRLQEDFARRLAAEYAAASEEVGCGAGEQGPITQKLVSVHCGWCGVDGCWGECQDGVK